MRRELLLSSFVAAGWLSLMFLIFGGLLTLSASIVGPGKFFSIMGSLGVIKMGLGASIERLSLIIYGLCMVVACVPVNYYWLKREARLREAFSGRHPDA